MNYTQAQIDRANAVSLEDFLRTQGETLIKSGREYRWKEHDSLTVRGNKWFRHSQSKGGYPIDFVMEFYGKSFPEAVQLLTGESGEGQTEASTTPPTAFHLPLHNRTADRAIQYLCYFSHFFFLFGSNSKCSIRLYGSFILVIIHFV